MSDLELWRTSLPGPTQPSPQLQERLWTLLARQTALYTGLDSTSVPVETAQELMDSISFHLRLGWGEEGESNPWIPVQDLSQVFQAGRQIIEKEILRGKRLWTLVSQTLPPLENDSLRDTVSEIGRFWSRYDHRFFAHQIPCQIDYQLCWPVDESLVGVAYVNRYLERLWIEHDLLSRFPPEEIIPILNAFCPNYRELPTNLYEPVAVNCIGRAMLGCGISGLSISPEQSRALCQQLEQLPRAAVEGALTSAARQAARQLNIVGNDSAAYLVRLSKELTPRVMAVRDSGDLGGIFLAPRP